MNEDTSGVAARHLELVDHATAAAPQRPFQSPKAYMDNHLGSFGVSLTDRSLRLSTRS